MRPPLCLCCETAEQLNSAHGSSYIAKAISTCNANIEKLYTEFIEIKLASVIKLYHMSGHISYEMFSIISAHTGSFTFL